MRNFFRRLRDSFRNRSATRRTPRERARQRTGAEDAVRRGQVTRRTGLDAIVSDVAMDTGLRPRDTEYYSRLNERQERSQQALADMRSRRRRRNDDKADDTTKPTEEVDDFDTDTNNDTNTNTTTLDPTTDTALTNVENISNQTFDNTDNISNYFDNTATSVNTAAGQEQNQASALTTSVGEAEDDAISYMTSGTGSNILTSAQGLLGDDEDEDDPFNRRKTLIGA